MCAVLQDHGAESDLVVTTGKLLLLLARPNSASIVWAALRRGLTNGRAAGRWTTEDSEGVR